MKKLEGTCHCGQVGWQFESRIASTTACDCTACRRYGALWVYGHLGKDIKVFGESHFYMRGKAIEFHFCPKCAGVVYYLGTKLDDTGRQKAAVNLRMSLEPDLIKGLLVDHFDGLDTFDDLPQDGRCVRDLWF